MPSTQFLGASTLLLFGLRAVMSSDDYIKRGDLPTSKWSGRVTLRVDSAMAVPLDVVITYPSSGAAAYPVLVMYNGFQVSCVGGELNGVRGKGRAYRCNPPVVTPSLESHLVPPQHAADAYPLLSNNTALQFNILMDLLLSGRLKRPF